MRFNISRRKQATPESPCGIAFDPTTGQVVLAEYAEGGGFDIYRLMADERRAVNITTTDLRTTLMGGGAHTDQASNLMVTADAPEDAILRALATATEADPHAFAFNRTPDGRIVVTQVEQSAVESVITRIEKWLAEQQSTLAETRETTLRVETRTRAIARLWKAGANVDDETGTVGFLIIGANDYAVALWSEQTGLVYETEEMFERGAGPEIKCQHARDMFIKFIAAPTLAKLRLPAVKRVIISAPSEYGDAILTTLRLSPSLAGVEVEPVSLNLGESESEEGSRPDQATAFAIGALLDDEHIPACNMATSPKELLEAIDRSNQEAAEATNNRKSRAAVLAMLIPFVALIAFAAAFWLDQSVEASQLSNRIEEETRVATQLQQANADYESSKANFGTFRALLDNLITLRQRQPATHQLLRDLNARWPQDPTWYISEINVKGGSVEIKGKTKNEQSVTAFAKSLEFSDGLFTGILTRNNVQGTGGPGQQPQPAAAGSAPQSSVIEFTVLSTYAPLATPGKPVAVPQQQAVSMPQQPATTNPLANQPQMINGAPQGMTPGRMAGPQMPNVPLPQPPAGVQR